MDSKKRKKKKFAPTPAPYLVLLLGVLVLKFKLLRLQLAQPLPQLIGFFPGLFWRKEGEAFQSSHVKRCESVVRFQVADHVRAAAAPFNSNIK